MLRAGAESGRKGCDEAQTAPRVSSITHRADRVHPLCNTAHLTSNQLYFFFPRHGRNNTLPLPTASRRGGGQERLRARQKPVRNRADCANNPKPRVLPPPLLGPARKNAFGISFGSAGVGGGCGASLPWEGKTRLCCGTLEMEPSGLQNSFPENWLTLGGGFARFLGDSSKAG